MSIDRDPIDLILDHARAAVADLEGAVAPADVPLAHVVPQMVGRIVQAIDHLRAAQSGAIALLAAIDRPGGPEGDGTWPGDHEPGCLCYRCYTSRSPLPQGDQASTLTRGRRPERPQPDGDGECSRCRECPTCWNMFAAASCDTCCARMLASEYGGWTPEKAARALTAWDTTGQIPARESDWPEASAEQAERCRRLAPPNTGGDAP